MTMTINPLRLMVILLVSAVCMNCSNPREQHDVRKSQTDVQSSIVQVIDFHSTHRCETCITIEEKTKATVVKYFSAELENGTITFQTVNVDEEENRAMAEEFAAFGTALFINVIKDGESTKVDLTNFAFMNATNDDSSFEDGLKAEVDKALKML